MCGEIDVPITKWWRNPCHFSGYRNLVQFLWRLQTAWRCLCHMTIWQLPSQMTIMHLCRSRSPWPRPWWRIPKICPRSWKRIPSEKPGPGRGSLHRCPDLAEDPSTDARAWQRIPPGPLMYGRKALSSRPGFPGSLIWRKNSGILMLFSYVRILVYGWWKP